MVWKFRQAAILYVHLIDCAKLLHQEKVELTASQDKDQLGCSSPYLK